MPSRPHRAPLGRAAALLTGVLFLVALTVAGAASATDTERPVLAVATLTPEPDGNANWRRVSPAMLNMSATDDVAVEKFQYSLDGGATYIDVPVTPSPSATASVAITQEGNTTVRYRAVDTSGNVSLGVAANTTLSVASAAGATAIRLQSITGRAAGDFLVIDTGGNQETATIASVVSPNPPAPAPNVNLTAPLAIAHAAGTPVVASPPFRTIAVLIDTFAPIATWPQIVDGTILQSQTLTPTRSDPRRRDPSDTANGSGGTAIRRMEVDGRHTIPFPLILNRLTVGKHAQAVALQDAAGNALKYTQTFVVTTSFDDLDTVIGQYAARARSTTLNGAVAAGAMGLRLQSPFGFRAGQTLLVDTGANQETVTIAAALSPPPTLNTTLSAAATAGATEVRLASYTTATTGGPNAPSNNGPIVGQPIVLGTGANQEVIRVARHLVPVPAAPAPNVVLMEPLQNSHAAGTATSLVNVVLSSPLTLAHPGGTAVSNPRPLLSAVTATDLRALLAEAKDQAALGNAKAAVATLNRFKALVAAEGKAAKPEGKEQKEEAKTTQAALTSAADALIAQVRGGTVDTTGTGVTTSPWEAVIRQFPLPTPFEAVPGATYKVLVNGNARGFRHEHIVQTEWLVQQLGRQHGFDVEVWDPNIGGSPGRQAPAGISLTENPLLDLDKLMEYRTLVFASTVGANAQGLTAAEFANLQAYVRAGGGFVAVHGATDSMQNVPWYMDLVGAGFTNHGGNVAGIMPDCSPCGEVELITVDPGNPTTKHLPERFTIHDELYNTNRNPLELGIVHPLMTENEATLVGQLSYSTGSLMNSDDHGMTWCRNFDGGQSFTTVLGHSWALNFDSWFRQMLLKAIQTTAGVAKGNCVTYREVSELIASDAAAGMISDADAAMLSSRLAAAKAAFDAGDYKGAIPELEQLTAQAKQVGTALLTAKGQELIDWAKGMK